MLDNDRTMRELLAFALRGRGMEAVPADGLEAAEEALGGVDGLLLDFQLGGGHTGAEVARRWAAEERLPPFWLVTGMPEDPEVQALRELGELEEVVGKPFSLMELADRVQGTLRKVAQTNGVEDDLSSCTERTCDDPTPLPEGSQEVCPHLLSSQEDRTDPHQWTGPDSVV